MQKLLELKRIRDEALKTVQTETLTLDDQSIIDKFKQLPDDPILIFQEIQKLYPLENPYITDVDIFEKYDEDEEQFQQIAANAFQTEDDKRTIRITNVPRGTLTDQLRHFLTERGIDFESVTLRAGNRRTENAEIRVKTQDEVVSFI